MSAFSGASKTSQRYAARRYFAPIGILSALCVDPKARRPDGLFNAKDNSPTRAWTRPGRLGYLARAAF
jgi:hypothetical protein